MPLHDFDNPIYQAEDEEDYDLPEELARLLKQEEKVIQPYQEYVEIVNIETEDDVKEFKIGVALEESVKKRLIEMLEEFVDVFAWSYHDMLGL